MYVNDVASGNVSYNRSKQIKGVDQAEADKRIASFNITADKYEITPYLTDKLNHVAYKKTRTKLFKITMHLVNLHIVILKNFNHSTIKSGLSIKGIRFLKDLNY